VVHDDSGDFLGTFIDMTAVNDKLELSVFEDDFEETVGTDPSNWTVTENTGDDIDIDDTRYYSGTRSCKHHRVSAGGASIRKILSVALTDTKGYVRFALNHDNLATGYPTLVLRDSTPTTFITLQLNTSGGDGSSELESYNGSTWDTIKTNMNWDQWYLIETIYDLSTDTFDCYVDSVLEATGLSFQNSVGNVKRIIFYTGNSDGDWFLDYFKIIDQTGNYESQTIDVGSGVDWGTFSWTENADGATIVAKVKTSPDGSDWSESWQTLNSGDYITGNNRYLKYRFEITNGTKNTYIDDVTIEYAV